MVAQGEQERPTITGTYDLKSEHGYPLGSFQIRIRYPAQYPRPGVLPEVYLESHRDQWKTGYDSHIEPHWRLCLFVIGESGIRSDDPQSLPRVIAALHTFLLRELMYQDALRIQLAGGPKAEWPGPQRSHGAEGLREAVRERGLRSRNLPCPCGSGKKFKKCHWNELRPR